MDRDAFFARKPKTDDVTLDDDSVWHVRKLSEGEVSTINKKYAKDDKALEGFRFIVCRCVVNEDGRRVFEDTDLEKLSAIDFDTIQAIATKAMAFSGIASPKA